MCSSTIRFSNLLAAVQAQGIRCTFLGVGPVTKNVVLATFEACRRNRCVPIFIASRNQIDLKSLGYGYLMGGMDQRNFFDLLNHIKDKVGYDGPVIVCRDHGGPWQRDVELNKRYPFEKAMNIARQSFMADIQAGFNYLHIDPTKCPFPFSQEDLCTWTVDLIEFCEGYRKQIGKGPIDYEVGTEDIKGGLTSNETFESFLKNLSAKLNQKGLPLPTSVVGQTGTLTRVNRNVGLFDPEQTRKLVEIASRFGIGFKEHNADYLNIDACRMHPQIGITGMNVAPEFGYVESKAYFELAELEEMILRDGQITREEVSQIREKLSEKVREKAPWQKWLTDEMRESSEEKIWSDKSLSLLMTGVCGHYVLCEPEIEEAIKRLFQNLRRFSDVQDPDQFVIMKVVESIEFYIEHLQLKDSYQMSACSS